MFDAHAEVPGPTLSGLGSSASWLSSVLTGAINGAKSDSDISVTTPTNLGMVGYVKMKAAEHPLVVAVAVLGVVGVGIYFWSKR